MKKYYGEEFINKIYKNLFESDIVKRSGNMIKLKDIIIKNML